MFFTILQNITDVIAVTDNTGANVGFVSMVRGVRSVKDVTNVRSVRSVTKCYKCYLCYCVTSVTSVTSVTQAHEHPISRGNANLKKIKLPEWHECKVGWAVNQCHALVLLSWSW